MMIAELIVGTWTRSLALTADGWHMATHAGALGFAALAYWFARTRSRADDFTFGTGKVYALAGFTNAVVLVAVALWMGVEALLRLLHPEPIAFAEALPVAVLGLVVNLVSALLLDPHEHPSDAGDEGHVHDHNLRAAYLHVIADAVTSVAAIAALVCGRYLGLRFLDPVMALVSGLVILRWGAGLCRTSALQLLDAVPERALAHRIRSSIELLDDARVTDLHVWELGPGRRGCIVSLSASAPRSIEEYRTAILTTAKIEHLTVEVTRCRGHAVEGDALAC
jgi:cation diffusion facilitator family transporter